MIQLKAQPKPVELTASEIRKLTKEFIKTEKSVWKKDYITEPLLKMSFGKCCFCETKVNEESKYMEVEHFYPKSIYKFKVVSWKNLLPICGRCNKKKLKHDTKKEPIIHPVFDNPKEHLKLKNYRFYGKTDLGKLTKDIVDLNDRQRLVNVRSEIGVKLLEGLDDLLQSTQDYIANPITRRRNKIIGKLKNILLEGTKEYEYSATAATVLLEDDNYKEIKQLFIDINLWNHEFIQLEKEVEFCALT
jgi:uncharacterized protein (TIGR02646 family)